MAFLKFLFDFVFFNFLSSPVLDTEIYVLSSVLTSSFICNLKNLALVHFFSLFRFQCWGVNDGNGGISIFSCRHSPRNAGQGCSTHQEFEEAALLQSDISKCIEKDDYMKVSDQSKRFLQFPSHINCIFH